MKKRFLAVFVILAAFSAHAQQSGIHEGNWNITTTISGAGMDPQAQQELSGMTGGTIDTPGGKANMSFSNGGMTLTSTKCLTNQSPVPDAASTPGCSAPQIQHNGNTVNYQITCGQMSMDGNMTFTGDTLTGTTTSHQKADGKDVTSTAHISGKYLGPCQ